MTEVKKDYVKLAEKVLTDSDKFLVRYSSEDGNLLLDKSSLKDISSIIAEGLTVSNYIIEHQLYADNAGIQDLLGKITKEADKLAITEENAKQLNFRDALIHWSKIHALVITLCAQVLTLEAE